MIPDFILRRSLPRGVRLPRLPVLTAPENIFEKIRKNRNIPIPASNGRARDYRRALILYLHHKMLAERLVKQEKIGLQTYLYHKDLERLWRGTMDHIEKGEAYTMFMDTDVLHD